MANYNDIILGKGITFPLVIDSDGRVPVESDEALIRKSIITILSWPVHTRYFLGEFGSMLELLIEDPNDLILFGLAKHYIVDAITTWETRIKALEVPYIKQENNRLDIHLHYTIIKTAQPDSFIYPFYAKPKY